MINRVKAFGITKNNPTLAIIIPRKMGFLEIENIPLVTSFALFSSSMPILQEFTICVCAIQTKIKEKMRNPQPIFCNVAFSKYQKGSKYLYHSFLKAYMLTTTNSRIDIILNTLPLNPCASSFLSKVSGLIPVFFHR